MFVKLNKRLMPSFAHWVTSDKRNTMLSVLKYQPQLHNKKWHKCFGKSVACVTSECSIQADDKNFTLKKDRSVNSMLVLKVQV